MNVAPELKAVSPLQGELYFFYTMETILWRIGGPVYYEVHP